VARVEHRSQFASYWLGSETDLHSIAELNGNSSRAECIGRIAF